MDSSVYSAMINMSQWWKNNVLLIDTMGNNGSIDNDPCSAMRYLELRLTEECSYFVEDLKYNTVDMIPNYDDTELEPTVLPAKLPFLLINGVSGIATGYSTDIPPFNINELIEGCLYILSHQKVNENKLYEIIPAPDFPTGGEIVKSKELKDVLKYGKGKIEVRAKAKIIKDKANQIIINEIPYEVVKQTMVAKMTEYALNNKDLGINEIRDESDKGGIRIVVELKKTADAKKVLDKLYKNTDLAVSYSANMVSIIDKTPVLCGVKQCLESFLEFRKDVVYKRALFILNKSTERLEIIEGLIKATSIMDKIIKCIKESKNRADVIVNLQKKFKFTEKQAIAIAEMKLYRLSNTDIVELKKEKEDLLKTIKENEKIIKDKKEVVKVIQKELKEIQKETLKSYQRKTNII